MILVNKFIIIQHVGGYCMDWTVIYATVLLGGIRQWLVVGIVQLHTANGLNNDSKCLLYVVSQHFVSYIEQFLMGIE